VTKFTNYARLTLGCVVVVLAAARIDAGATNQGVPDLLSSAFGEYNASNVRQAEASCGSIITVLLGISPLTDAQVQQLLTAYELRGRARVILKNEAAAREDFRALLIRSPSHEFGSLTIDRAGPVSPVATSTFDAAKADTISSVVFNITPEDAEVQFRGVALPADKRAGGRPVLAPVGSHTVTVQRRMYESQQVAVDVQPGVSARVDVQLKRLKSQIDIITSAPGVEITIDNVKVDGATTDAPLPEKYAKLPEVRELGTTPGWKTVSDISPGTPTVRLRKDCYLPEDFPIRLDVPSDSFVVRPMRKASATLRITGSGGTVWIDGEDTRQSLPYTGELCPKTEPRVVEIRSARGRHVERIEPTPGAKIEIVANPRPAIAILAQNGLPAGYMENLRETLEKILIQNGMEGATFFSLNSDAAQRAMKGVGVQPGWLALDQEGRELADAAKMMTPITRQSAAATLSKSLDVQGVAEITVPSFREQRSLLLTYLANGSGVPETIPINLTDARSIQSAVAYFNGKFRVTRVGSGLSVADVKGVTGAVVLRQPWMLTGETQLVEGDVIVTADGAKVQDGSSFNDLIATRKAGDVVALQVQRKGAPGPLVPVRLTTHEFAQVVAYSDQTLPLNKLLLEFRLAVEDAPPERQAIRRLNLAVVLMRVESWSLAKAELDKVTLPDLKVGEDISRGTVQYYLGLCLDRLGRVDEADQAYQAAMASRGALLTADGPPVQLLAEQQLKDKSRRGR
jgi:hypothetical protein